MKNNSKNSVQTRDMGKSFDNLPITSKRKRFLKPEHIDSRIPIYQHSNDNDVNDDVRRCGRRVCLMTADECVENLLMTVLQTVDSNDANCEVSRFKCQLEDYEKLVPYSRAESFEL
jgi:hypothetical protein